MNDDNVRSSLLQLLEFGMYATEWRRRTDDKYAVAVSYHNIIISRQFWKWSVKEDFAFGRRVVAGESGPEVEELLAEVQAALRYLRSLRPEEDS